MAAADTATSSRGAPPMGGMAGPTAGDEPFGAAAEKAIRDAQAAVHGLIDEAGLGGSRAVDLARSLKLDKTLAWKLARFADNDDPCAAFKHLPGPGGVEIVVRAAEQLGVAEDRLAAVRRADRDLRGLVRKHAGDRRTFEAMLAGARPDPQTESEERKAFFRAGSAIWGVRAAAQVLTLALRPNESDESMLDCVQVSGFINLERLRPDVPWVVRRLRVHRDDGSPFVPFERVPLDPEGAVQSEGADRPLSLMSAFCSKPLPSIRQRLGDNGWLYDELAPGDVGRRGAATIIAGERYIAALPRYRDSGNTEGRYILTVRTPIEHVQLDLLLHPSLTNFRWPTMNIVGNLEERIASERAPGRELVSPRPAEHLARGASVSLSPIPSYSGLVRDAFARAGWGEPDAFRAFRAAFDHPPAPCEVSMTCELDQHTTDA
ncbi:MAG: hypothetical protein AAFN41_02700 [Planctomycetota bacterium]